MEKEIRVFRTREEIADRVEEIAEELSRDCREVVVVCVLKGAAVFCADLIRAMSRDGISGICLEFLKVKSYAGRDSTGRVRIDYFSGDVKGRDVLIVEDIVDTGRTIKEVRDFLKKGGARSVKVCTLLDKPSRRENEQRPEYVGFEVPDRFVVGYGLDCDEKYRELDYIGFLK